MRVREASFCLIAAVACCVGFAHGGYAAQLSKAAAPLAEVLERALDQVVTVRLTSGTTYEGVTLAEIERDSRTGEPRRVRVRLDTGRMRTVSLSVLASLERDSVVVYAAPAQEEGDRPARRRMTRAERKAAEEEQARRDAEEEHAKWLVRLQARGVQPWPDVTPEQYDAATERNREFVEEVRAEAPSMQLFETENFLFCTNIPPQQVAPFVRSLDEMHYWMCKTYGIDPEENRVWLGKTPVFAFLTKEQFMAFEQQKFGNSPAGAYGICHQSSNGKVTIACYRGQQPEEFGQMLVHETSHGFIHRYKTKKFMPSWVNEGMADYIGSAMVPKSRSNQRGERRYRESLLQMAKSGARPTIPGRLFTGPRNISFDLYPVAYSLTRFMLTSNGEAYVKFIELLKEGTPQEEALEKSFGVTFDELVVAYGRWVGVPGLSLGP